MDPRSKAEWDLAMAEFRMAIGQEPEPNVLMAPQLRSYYAMASPLSISPTGRSPLAGGNQHWHQQIPHISPAAARAIMGLPLYFPRPSPWDRLKGRVTELRTRLALTIGRGEVIRSDDCY